MSQYHRKGSWYFRYWHHGVLYEKGGFPSKRAAQEGEWDHRKRVGATAGALTPSATPTLQDAVTAYLAATEGHHAPETRTHVVAALQRFVAYAQGSTRLSHVTVDMVLAYKAWRAAQPSRRDPTTPVKGATVNRDLTYICAFCAWCAHSARRWIRDNPATASAVGRYAEPWPVREVLDDAAREELWKRLEAGHPKFAHDPRYRRVRIMGELLFLLGVRRGVILELRWDQVDWANRLLQYHSKGKDRVVPLSARALALLREVWDDAGQPVGGRVFPARSDTTFRRLWERVRAEMGRPRLRRHDLRVAFARELASRGVDLVTIKDLGGWSSLDMVARYVPPYLSMARNAVEQLSGGAE